VKPGRTVLSDRVFRLPGGTEDNDLWVTTYGPDMGGPALGSVWVPTDEERKEIADGANVELITHGEGTPPVSMRVDTTPLGKAHPEHAETERRELAERQRGMVDLLAEEAVGVVKGIAVCYAEFPSDATFTAAEVVEALTAGADQLPAKIRERYGDRL
jgi:hypothetical protein